MRPVSTIVRATGADLSYVVHLQKRHGSAVGFLPRIALQEKIDRGQIWLATENDEPAGFLHHGSLRVPEVRIFQAAVQFDAQRRYLGMALVRNLIDRAIETGARGISLRCLSNLDANAFWESLGFDLHTTEAGARGTLNVWTQRLQPTCESAERTQLVFHSRYKPCPVCGTSTTDTWTQGAIRRRICRKCLGASRDHE